MIVEIARDPRELERTFHHAEGRVAVAIQDSVRKRAVVCPDPHRDPARVAQPDQRRKALADSLQLRCVLFVRVFADDEFFRICVIARVNSDLLHPFRRFHCGLWLEMNVGHDWHIAAALAQTFDDVLEIPRILHCWRGDPDDFAASICEFDGLLDRRLRVHRVTRDHRLDTDRIVAADPDVAYLYFARLAALVVKRITTIVHKLECTNTQATSQCAAVLWRLRVLRGRLGFQLVELFADERQILHVEERDVEHVTDDYDRAAGLNYLQHAHVHRSPPHRFDERQHNVTAVEHGNRQHVQNRKVHVQNDAKPQREFPTAFGFKQPYVNIPNPDRAA